MTHNGRVLQCVDCHLFVRVYEVRVGEGPDASHEYLEELGPYSCGDCLSLRGEVSNVIAERLAKEAA